MNVFVFLILLGILLTSIFWIIPTYASPKDQDTIKNWLGLGFSGLMLVISLVETRAQDPALIPPVLLYVVVLALCLSGVYWWIPTYIKPAEQSDAIKWMFLSTSFAIILTNILTKKAIPATISMGGRRR